MSRRTQTVYLTFISAAVLAIAALIVAWNLTGTAKSSSHIPVSLPTEADNRVVLVESSGITARESVIDTTVIQDGLNDMGVLITEEYYFTEVVNFSSVKKLFNFEIGLTESSYMESYDGSVSAGIDFSKIRVIHDEIANRITVTLPRSTVQNVTIDPNSFTLYSEKEGIGNRISASDFNGSLIELKQTAEEKAIAKGVLERADQNAEQLIANFIRGMIDLSDCIVEFVRP